MDESSVKIYFYSVLELPPGAPLDKIKGSYKKQVRKWHTDRLEHNEELRNMAQEKLIEINLAYECLSDPEKLRKFMIRAARTGWKPGQKSGAGGGKDSGQKAASNGGESTGKADNQQKGQDNNQQEEQNSDAGSPTEKVRQAAINAAREAAQSARAVSEKQFYDLVFERAVGAAKLEAENQVNLLKLPLREVQLLYDFARNAGEQAAKDELAKFKNSQGVYTGPSVSADQLKIVGIVIGLVVIMMNVNKLWQPSPGQVDNTSTAVSDLGTHSARPSLKMDPPIATPSAMDPETTPTLVIPSRLQDQQPSIPQTQVPDIPSTPDIQPTKGTLTVSWDDPDREAKLNQLNGYDTVEITDVPPGYRIEVHGQGLRSYFTVAGTLTADSPHHRCPFSMKTLIVNGQIYDATANLTDYAKESQ